MIGVAAKVLGFLTTAVHGRGTGTCQERHPATLSLPD